MRHSNVDAISLRVNTMDNIVFSVNNPFASGPSLVDIDSIGRFKKKNEESFFYLSLKAFIQK